VAPDRLRFDFTHFSQVATQSLEAIEQIVNQRIQENIPTEIEEMDADEAFKTGATALFEEKYGERVRVVSLTGFSKELCGGTHTDRTGNIGLFKIVSETSVSSGVRRIEAVTGEAALAHTQQLSRIVQDTAHLLKEKPQAVVERVKNLLAEVKTLEKEIQRLRAKLAAQSADASVDAAVAVNGVRVLARRVAVDTTVALRDLADQFKEKIKSGIVVLGSSAGGKAMLIAVVTKDLAGRYHAGRIVKEVAAMVGGSGGGRPDMAQAGGNQPQNLDSALEKVYEVVRRMK